MTRRTKNRFVVALIAVLAVGIVTSIVGLVWYDLTRGSAAPPEVQSPTLPDLGLTPRDVAADIRRAQRAIQPEGFLGIILARFHRRAGRYPAQLEELLERPADLPPARWDGPYVSTPDVLTDPWGARYQYRCPGVHNENGYDMWSMGLDRVDGTKDDIGNW